MAKMQRAAEESQLIESRMQAEDQREQRLKRYQTPINDALEAQKAQEVLIHKMLQPNIDSRRQMRKKGTDPVALNAYYKQIWAVQGDPEKRRERILEAKANQLAKKAYRKREIERQQEEYVKRQAMEDPLANME